MRHALRIVTHEGTRPNFTYIPRDIAVPLCMICALPRLEGKTRLSLQDMIVTPLNSTFRQFAHMFLGRAHVDEDIPFADQIDRPSLDGSIESLPAVDNYLAHVKANLSTLTEKQLHDVAFRCGAYVGECIRMTWPEAYDWTDYAAFIPDHPEFQAVLPERNLGTSALLVRKPDIVLTPVKHVLSVLQGESPDGVHPYAEAERQHHPSS
jgi:hypothetical protein